MQPENLIKRDFIAKRINQNITHTGEKKTSLIYLRSLNKDILEKITIR